MLHLYREAIALRRRLPGMSQGEFRWLPTEPGVLAFMRGDGFACVVNCSSRPVCMPVDGHVLHASKAEVGEKLPPDSAAWLLVRACDE
jgi:alpha-glucosidase